MDQVALVIWKYHLHKVLIGSRDSMTAKIFEKEMVGGSKSTSLHVVVCWRIGRIYGLCIDRRKWKYKIWWLHGSISCIYLHCLGWNLRTGRKVWWSRWCCHRCHEAFLVLWFQNWSLCRCRRWNAIIIWSNFLIWYYYISCKRVRTTEIMNQIRVGVLRKCSINIF